MAVTDLQESGHMPHLFGKRRPDRAARHKMAVADATHRIDNDQRIIQCQACALEAIIHDDEIHALLHQPMCTFHPLAGDDRHRLAGKQQRFIADISGAVLRGIYEGRDIKCAAITTAQEAGFQALCGGGSGDCHCGRRLSCTTYGEVADADDRNGNARPFCRAHPPAGNIAVEKGKR